MRINRIEQHANRAPARGSMVPRTAITVEFFARMLRGGIIKGTLELESHALSGAAKIDKVKEIIKKKKDNIEPNAFAEELKKI